MLSFVDSHSGNIDYCLGSVNSYEDLSLDDIDYLENIDESDLLNFTNCDELNFSSILPDTPPETPITHEHYYHLNGQANLSDSPRSANGNILPEQFDNLPLDSAFSNSQLNLANNITVANSPTIIIPQPNVVPSTIATCISPSTLVIPSIVNCQSVLSTVDLNGFKLNGKSLVYTKSADNGSFSKNNIQPKSVLHSQISPKLAEKQKEFLKNQTLEARKHRNREAALNSRLKKKEYVDGLETDIKKITKERDVLLVENKFLKVKVKDLENQLCSKARLDINGNYDSNKKAKISYFAVLFMVFFQISPYIISMAPSSSSSPTNSTSFSSNQLLNTLPLKANSQKIGRTLLWKSDSEYPNDNIGAKGFNSSATTVYANMTRSILCKDFYNETESLRLETELRDWLTRFKLEEKQHLHLKRKLKSSQLPKSKQNNKRLLFDSKYVPIPRLKMWMQKQKYGDYLPEELEQGNNNAEPLKYGLDYDSLMATVHRRDDTFYYLSYPSKGHLFLPPISNRTDVRPRFSFLIPTFHNLSLDGSQKNSDTNLNSSISPQMFILQIDCQVINTKVTLINDENHRFDNKTNKLVPTQKMYKLPNKNNSK